MALLTGSDRRPIQLWFVPVVLGVACLLGIALTWPSDDLATETLDLGLSDQIVQSRVDAVDEAACSFDDTQRCIDVAFSVLEGPDAGTTQHLEYLLGPGLPTFEVGSTALLGIVEDAPPELRYQFVDFDRSIVLWLIAALFAVAVVGLGRLRGLAALGGLAASVVIIVWYVIPAIVAGRDPVLVAMIGAVAIGLIALYLAHGFNDLTHAATVGTVAALALTTALSAITVAAARFTGFVDDDSFTVALAGIGDVQGLVLAGIVLGSLGALDDVTVTQASTVWELRSAAPDLDQSGLFSAGLRVGRDHIASTVNTLLLAYAGASMPLLLRLALSRQPIGVSLNSEAIATEVVRTLVGSIGLVMAVPITTWLAARLAVDPHRPRPGIHRDL